MACGTDYGGYCEYYNINVSEDEILFAGELVAKRIPYTRARQRMGAEMGGRRNLIVRNRSRTPRAYKVGDKVAFEADVNLGTATKTVMYGIVGIGEIKAETQYGYVVDGMKMSCDCILGRIRD